VSEEEASPQLVEDNLETVEKAEARFEGLKKHSKRKHKGTETQSARQFWPILPRPELYTNLYREPIVLKS
jgi:hypothetical protein